MKAINEFLSAQWSATWHAEAEAFLDEFIKTRYGLNGRKAVSLRCPYFSTPDGVAFAGVLHRESPTSGGYGGTSLVVFPAQQGGALVALGVGTQGLSPDEAILTRPGHARMSRAIASWLRSSKSISTAWSKTDPTRTDVAVPIEVARQYDNHAATIKRYGEVLYLAFDSTTIGVAELEVAFVALFDFYMSERGVEPLTRLQGEANNLRTQYESRVLLTPNVRQIHELLLERRFLVLQGPPGTGKTRTASSLIRDQFGGNGAVIQFHPSIGYEQFVGGLAPIEKDGKFGFAPRPGSLWDAAKCAKSSGQPYLLVIDEINRADLARTLGEAIYLFEPKANDRKVRLSYDYGPPWHDSLQLPQNLFVLGTMNSADRSIAILDLAIRRRFAFVDIWPDGDALNTSAAMAQEAFSALRRIFMSHANEEQLELLPGHAYFLAQSNEEASRRIKTELAPLLRDYCKQGLVAGFVEEIQGYLQWLESKAG